jgi:hypothetical protein
MYLTLSPIVIALFFHAPALISEINWSNAYSNHFWYPISNFIIWSGSYLWFALPLVVYSMYKFKSYQSRHLFYALWIGTFLIGMYVSFSRWIPLFIVPFALFEGSMISKFTEVKA